MISLPLYAMSLTHAYIRAMVCQQASVPFTSRAPSLLLLFVAQLTMRSAPWRRNPLYRPSTAAREG